MAKLPPLTNSQSIGTSDLNTGGYMRLQQPNTAPWRAVSQAGGALDQLAGEQRRLEAHLAAKREATAKSDGNLLLESALMDYEQTVQKKAIADAENMPEGGIGYAAGVSDFAGKEADRIISEKFSSREDQEYVAMRFQRARQNNVSNALNHEMKVRNEWRTDITEKKVADLTGAIGVDPRNYPNAAAEFESFVENSIPGGKNTKDKFKQLGFQKLARAEAESVAAHKPFEFRAAFKGAFENQPAQAAEPHVVGIVDSANDNGLNPSVLLAVAKIESQVDPKAGSPTRADGTAMSSATGMWQITDRADTLEELGISKEDRTNYEVATPAVARFFARQQTKLLSAGQQPTPGKLFMTYNLGPGAATAIMRAKPDEKIESVMTRVYANKGPDYVEQVLSNNPQFYKRGMTVGQVRENYENKMASAAEATKGYVTGKNISTDDQARALFKSMGLAGTDHLTAADAAEIFVKTTASIGKQTKEQASLARGVGILNGVLKANPYDTTTHTDVDNAVAANNLSAGIATGDPNALLGARLRTKSARFIPLPDVNAFREAMNTEGAVPAKMAAYAALADISTNDRVAFDASKIPEDERSRVNEYRAYTENLLLSPAEAVKRIDDARTPEGKKAREVAHDAIRKETRELGWETIEASPLFDKSMWSTPEVTTERQKWAAETALRTSYENYRLSGKGADEAQALALQDMDRMWGVSNLSGSPVFMPFPPERNYGPGHSSYSSDETGGSFDWIQKQARNTALAHLVEAGRIKSQIVKKNLGPGLLGIPTTVTPGEQFQDMEVRLIPARDGSTAAAYRSNKPLPYELWYRKPDGTTDIVPGPPFIPNQHQAEQEYKAEYAKRVPPITVPTGHPVANFTRGFIR